jgi:hypothetical protein
MHLVVRDCQSVSGITPHIWQKPFQALVALIEMALYERRRILRRGGFGYFRVGAKFTAIEPVAGAFPRRPNLQRLITESASHQEAPNSLQSRNAQPPDKVSSALQLLSRAPTPLTARCKGHYSAKHQVASDIMDAAALTSYLARNDNNHDREFEPSGI